ncbi:hypothetical protein BKA70DRAFT_1200978 [Coprinopsis sp. MPI-PUGE-AT-0042]|nr:hypothetical protein BKA70DRAFT_1200978 [Coprinopsis sp. MPI-PUGE-AT-0042]
MSALVTGSVHSVELNTLEHGEISSVSVYSAHAEVTRSFKIGLKAGANQVRISGLPNVLNRESLRVEGKGSATITDVTISPPAAKKADTADPKIAALKEELERTVNALGRTRSLVSSTEKYLQSATAQYVDVSKLKEVTQNYEEAAKRLDDEIIKLKKERSELEQRIQVEGIRSVSETRRTVAVSIAVVSEQDSDVELIIIYAVSNAKWACLYDVRVDTDAEASPMAIGYKASITQDTGEDWNDAAIKLETASPTFGMAIPSLSRWTVRSQRSAPPWRAVSRSRSRSPRRMRPAPQVIMPPSMRAPIPSDPRLYTRRNVSPHYAPASPSISPPPPIIPFANRDITTNDDGTSSSIAASFVVPGKMTIPSDSASHIVAIAEIPAEADLEWVCVPKRDSRVYLKAKVKNNSEYTLLQGPANIYVDGSLVARSNLPFVSPDETFDCTLGLDPSIRVTYSPLSKKTATQTGFMTKPNRVQSFIQRVAIHNTKSSALAKLKIIDQIPVSEEAGIIVKVISPALPTILSSSGHATTRSDAANITDSSSKGLNQPSSVAPANSVDIGQGIVAQWEGLEDTIVGEALGKDMSLIADGQFAWVCTNLASQAKVNLVLQWEVSAPVTTDICGL